MKNLIKLFIPIIFIFLNTVNTCEDDRSDYFYSKQLNIPNLIDIETKDSYLVNDYIYFNAQFSRFLSEPGYTNPLDILLNNRSEKYYIGYSLEKKTIYNNWGYLNLNGNIIVDKGEMNTSNAICVLNKITNNFEFRGGIKLLEAGTYRLNINTYLQPNNDFYYSNEKTIQIQINTTINDYGNENTYEFTVN